MGKACYYEDFKEGQSFTTPRRTVTEADIINFAGVSGDFHPLHTDSIHAEQTMFGARIAHGLLTISIVTGLWMRLNIFEESLIAFYGVEKLRWIKPVKAGDTIWAKLTVAAKRDKNESSGVIVFKNEIHKQDGELVAVFDALLLLKKRR
ncbi:MaoC/PaaZ C-terminal domain-containing protein [Thermoflexus hugenholtzii]